MTRYIDAYALKERINKASMQTDSFALVTAFCTLNYLIDNFTTVDAIPIEWILNHERMPKEGKGHDAIMDMITDWRREHDTAD